MIAANLFTLFLVFLMTKTRQKGWPQGLGFKIETNLSARHHAIRLKQLSSRIKIGQTHKDFGGAVV